MKQTAEIKTIFSQGRMVGYEAVAPSTAPGTTSSSSLDRANTFLSYVLLIGGLLTIAAALYLTIASYSPAPVWDEWGAIASLADSPRPLPFSWFLKQNNEHRILLFRLLLIADLRFFHGRHVPFFIGMYVIQFTFLILIGWMLKRVGGVDAVLWRSAMGLAAFCLFCPSQFENLSWSFQFSFFVPECFALIAFVSAALYQRWEGRPLQQWASLFLGLIIASLATYSNANGMLVWPLLIGIGMLLRLPRKVCVLYGVIGVSVVAAYFIGYKAPSIHASPIHSIQHPLLLLEYVVKYFGGSFPPSDNRFAIPIGASALLGTIALDIWVALRGYVRRPVPAILIALIHFSLITAFITALGRINFGTDQAFASRYQTFALPFWFSTICLLLIINPFAKIRIFRTLLLGTIVVVMIISAGYYRFSLQDAKDRRMRWDLASIALMTNVPDEKALAPLYPDPAVLLQYAPYLQDRQLSIFSTDMYQQLGQPLLSAYRLTSQQTCQGYIDSVERTATSGKNFVGLRLSGWTIDSRSKWPVQRIVLSDGVIVGFGIPGVFRPDVGAALFSRRAVRSGWTGLARVATTSRTVDVYGVLEHGEICPVAHIPVPVNLLAEFKDRSTNHD